MITRGDPFGCDQRHQAVLITIVTARAYLVEAKLPASIGRLTTDYTHPHGIIIRQAPIARPRAHLVEAGLGD